MYRYVLKRILIMIPVVLGVTVLIFSIMHLAPGDAAVTILGSTATDAELAAKRAQLGLDLPFLTQLFNYLKNMILSIIYY